MFGFLNISKDDLSPEEHDRYMAVYCGLCHTLGDENGQLSRLALSNDMTFLTLLHASLHEPVERTWSEACAMHPLKPRTCAASDYTVYAADMTVALAYFKMLDDWNDDGKRSALAASKALEKRYKVIRVKWPRHCRALEEGLAEISRIEGASKEDGDASGNDGGRAGLDGDLDGDCAGFDGDPAGGRAGLDGDPGSWRVGPDGDSRADRGINVFGRIMGELYVVDADEPWADYLRAFGFALGRFVYLMDAAVDLADDEKSGAYNPFVNRRYTPDDIRLMLMDAAGLASEAFERLPLENDLHLLRSVLYAGVWQQFNKTYAPETAADAADATNAADATATAADAANASNAADTPVTAADAANAADATGTASASGVAAGAPLP